MQNQVVLITGGTGSFGRAFCLEALKKCVKQVRIFSRDELKQAQMKEEINDSRVEYLCGDIRDKERLEVALEGADIVIHAAAMKRIEKCEKDPQEAIKTNVLGSMNVVNACLTRNVKHAILISTDKAVYPINLYGATKLAAEKVWNQSNTYRGLSHPTKFSVVRYGNVLGSRGSVLHYFRDQIKKGSVKVTDPDMTRYFLTIQNAVDLVQLALEFQQGGEIFLPVLKAVNIYRLAHLIAGDVSVEITSQRGAEKLHESLVTKEESKRLVSYKSFNVINPEFTTWPYTPWTSEFKQWSEDSSKAVQYTDEELTNLVKTI